MPATKRTIDRRQFLGGATAVASAQIAQPATEAKLPSGLTVALVQFDAIPEKVERNLREVERLSEEAVSAGAQWVVFHEGTLCDYTPRVTELAESVPSGPSTKRIEKLARRLGCSISFGLSEVDDGRYFITQVFVQADGFVHRYRKTWLWHGSSDENYRDEWARYDPGTGPEMFTFDGVRAGCLICADGDSLRCIRRLADIAPQVVFYPNNRTGLGDFQEYSQIARAIGAPMLVANRVGYSWEKPTSGGGVVYSASGEVLAKANREGREEILIHQF